MKDRFDLEEAITDIWGTSKDIKTIADTMYDNSDEYNSDRIHTILHGIAEILEAKVHRIENVFVEVFNLNKNITEKRTEQQWNSFFDQEDLKEHRK